VATILISSSIVKRLLWRASPLARGARFYSEGGGVGGRPPWAPTGTGAGPQAPALFHRFSATPLTTPLCSTRFSAQFRISTTDVVSEQINHAIYR